METIFYFTLCSFGLSNIIVYGKIFENLRELEINDEFIDIFKFNFEVLTKVFEDLNIDGRPLVDTYFKVAKIPQITIDALHNLEYKYKA